MILMSPLFLTAAYICYDYNLLEITHQIGYASFQRPSVDQT
jgi:hypothetical protein